MVTSSGYDPRAVFELLLNTAQFELKLKEVHITAQCTLQKKYERGTNLICYHVDVRYCLSELLKLDMLDARVKSHGEKFYDYMYYDDHIFISQ